MMGAREPEPIAVTQAKALAKALRKVPAVTVRRKGAVVTVTVPPAGTSAIVRVTLNPDAPEEPRRDARGRYRRRTGLVVTDRDCGAPRAEIVAFAKRRAKR